MSGWRIAPAEPSDRAAWAALRALLWAEDGADAHAAAIEDMLVRADPSTLALIARTPDGAAAGLAEAAIRHDHVNGCDGTPVLFLEGIYVEAAARGRGLGRALVTATAAWGRARGIDEFASDCALDDAPAHAFHRALGFAETERVVFFRQAIAP